MSVCKHDPRCPGHGLQHAKGLLIEESERLRIDAMTRRAREIQPTVTNPDKDRSLPGKRRRLARKAARR